jgi:activator of 2-hydroxyglutaryl-CoA dehydratase
MRFIAKRFTEILMPPGSQKTGLAQIDSFRTTGYGRDKISVHVKQKWLNSG